MYGAKESSRENFSLPTTDALPGSEVGAASVTHDQPVGPGADYWEKYWERITRERAQQAAAAAAEADRKISVLSGEMLRERNLGPILWGTERIFAAVDLIDPNTVPKSPTIHLPFTRRTQ